LVAEHSSGFVYLVSRTGVTGEQKSLSSAAGPLAEKMRQFTKLPIALGFGVSTPAHVADVARIADGVVVGSAIVKFIEANSASPDLAAKLEAFTRQMTAPLHAS
jgi:tryptophan synthase alpha chain